MLADAVHPSTNAVSMRLVSTASVNTSTSTFTAVSHGFTLGQRLCPLGTGAGMVVNADYYAIPVTADTFQVAKTKAAAGYLQPVPLANTTNVTFGEVHDLQTGDALELEAAINGLPVGQLFAIVLSPWSLKFAASFDDALNGIAIDLTGSDPFTFHHVIDSACNVQTGIRKVTPYDAGAVGDGVADDSRALQAAINYARKHHVPLIIEPGEFLINQPLYYLTRQTAHHSLRNSLIIESYGTLRQGPGFPAGGALLNLDANPWNLSDQSMAVAQGPHRISGLRLEGRGMGGTDNVSGIRFRGVDGALFEDMHVYDFSGRGIWHQATTLAGKDDVDASNGITLRNVKIELTGKEGFYGGDARCGTLKFDSCQFLYNAASNKVAAAGFTSINCTYANSGFAGDSNTGNLVVMKPATGALTRAVQIVGNMFEAGYWFDLWVLAGAGVVVTGNAFHPYNKHGALTQRTMDFGGYGVDGMVVEGNRVQAFVKTDHNIPAIRIRNDTTNHRVGPNSIANLTTQPIVYG